MHYYDHSIGDYRRDTAHLTIIEHGIYRQMLDTYYLEEKPLCLDHAKLMRSHSVRSADEVQAFENVLKDFFIRTEEGYIQRRCEAVITEYHAKSTKAAESANARWERVRKEKDAEFMRTHCEGNANHKPITNNHKPITKENTTPPAGADLFVGIDAQVVSDFKSMRMQMKAKITKTAIDGIKREALKAGLSLEGALRICCERGWRGFKADWITQPARGSPGKPEKFNPTEYVNRNRSDKNERDVNFDAEGNPV